MRGRQSRQGNGLQQARCWQQVQWQNQTAWEHILGSHMLCARHLLLHVPRCICPMPTRRAARASSRQHRPAPAPALTPTLSRLLSCSSGILCTCENMWFRRFFSALRTRQCTTDLGTVVTTVSHTMRM